MNSSLSPLSDFDGDADVGQLLYVKLMNNRDCGGYGGCISYKEFSSMCNAMCFTEEDAQDCWYDILMGVPVAKATDMSRFVEIFMFYAVSLDQSITKLFDFWEKEEKAPLCVAEGPSSSSGEVIQSPANPNPVKQTVQPAKGLNTKKTQRTRPTVPLCDFRRYTQNTTSSMNKISDLSDGRPQMLENAKPTRINPVFARLYKDAVRQREEQKAILALKEEEDKTSARALQLEGNKATAPRRRSSSPSTFAKPTQSFYAKVAATEKVYDPLDDAPETPRVAYHAPPGPSSFVPNGYIESVAKLRRNAECSRRTQFKDDLRSSIYTDPSVTLDGPILRLPISARDRRAVDIKLSQM